MTQSRTSFLHVTPTSSLLDVLRCHAGATEQGLPAGIALVVAADGALVGTITDGDVRRALLKHATLDVRASDCMQANPICFKDTLSFQDILESLPGELEKRKRATSRFLGKIVLVDEQQRPTRVLDYHQLWEQRVATHRHVVVIGLGYVGLTLALELSKEGFRVTGVDVDQPRIEALKRGESHVHEIGLPQLLREQLKRGFSLSTAVPRDGDVFVMAVGTPVSVGPSGQHEPDLTYLEAASREVASCLTTGDLVVLRSTVPVGTTRDVVVPILEAGSGLVAGRDFHVAFAPERTVEGKALAELRSLPQIIGGLNSDSVEATAALFRELTPTQVRVESLEAAELVKLINNGFRDLVFAFSNEIVRLAAAFNIDASDVIRAANRGYPRDPVPLPSPGVGGPCLTKDPYILGALGKRAGGIDTLAAHGRRVNESMHALVADQVQEALAKAGKSPSSGRVLICGLAFKGVPETGDLRSSSSMEIARILQGRGLRVSGHDPVATPAEIAAFGIEVVSLPDGFAGHDAVLFLNNHPSYAKVDVFSMVRALNAPAIVYDAWHVFRAEDIVSTGPATYLGLGFSRSSVEP